MSVIRRAVEVGINFFDTADVYSFGQSEEILGRGLKEFVPRREDAVVATKVYFPAGPGPNDRGLSRKHILASIDASLRRLGTDYVDLYQIHRWDHETPIEETLTALNDVVRAGKVRYIGASSMFAWQLMKALALQESHGWAHFVSMQGHYNLVYREEEREMLPLCRAEGLGMLPWSPLARGLLAGSRESGTRRAATDEQMAEWYRDAIDGPIVERVAEIASDRGVKAAQVALAWLLSKPGVSAPIVGASRRAHIDEAIGSLDLVLTSDEVTELEELYQPHGVLGHG
jgi:aryl-alcohol dehydrogenase-like predicted oxidoreductase